VVNTFMGFKKPSENLFHDETVFEDIRLVCIRARGMAWRPEPDIPKPDVAPAFPVAALLALVAARVLFESLSQPTRP
jgi:hypothetical protein